jgi:hypothetical protein
MNLTSENPASGTAELQLTRPPRLADAVWPYEVVLDGENAGEIRNRARIGLPISPGTHTLQIRSLHAINRRLGLASPAAAFEVSATETAEFVCHPRAFATTLFWWIACLLGDRSRWIMLERDPCSAPTASAGGPAGRVTARNVS